ncbi:NAD(P)/FAD-dependent oxidoreductase [Methylomonas rivi]|uniref:NAD(P)/FAD-dependent oxidoreductase n=1 Tax=Methylomonas rivi TaxID=2952226 RepID=A0ABT1U602_9GAMM|nr:FAD/NAD(P)-binding oxidoreductase [Methylomonas sp. WSC-6]MCQ8129250.1 NAD(P)/FAD-dependent oxidoreductase [Methylomonas sp. WSC-6]
MSNYRYLIIGGGMTAYAAINGIRAIDSNGTIGLISAEIHPPYKRPPLSKGLWRGKPLEKIWYPLEEQRVTLHLGCRAQTLIAADKTVIDDQGNSYHFEKLLIATGGDPVKLPFGGGFIGSEIAAALAMNGKQVTLLFPEEGIGAALFPHNLNQFLNGYYRDKGVKVMPRQMVTGLTRKQDRLFLDAGNVEKTEKQTIEVDAVVAGIGIKPNLRWLEPAGLAVDNGIVVDEMLRAGHPDIFAAGDAANFYTPSLGMRLRAEHEDNALTMGEYAGRNMAGESRPYHHLPYFYSDLFDLGYEAVGKTDSRLETLEDWLEPYKKGVIYYLEQGRVRGVLLWNVWDRVNQARALIAEPGPFTPADLQGKLAF